MVSDNYLRIFRISLFTALLFTYSHVFSQTKNLVSSKLTVALRKPDKNLDWLDEGAEEVNIGITITKNCIEINSFKKQEYSIISVSKNTKDLKIWYCRDGEGILCNVYIINPIETPLITYVVVEFDDVSWYYTCFDV